MTHTPTGGPYRRPTVRAANLRHVALSRHVVWPDDESGVLQRHHHRRNAAWHHGGIITTQLQMQEVQQQLTHQEFPCVDVLVGGGFSAVSDADKADWICPRIYPLPSFVASTAPAMRRRPLLCLFLVLAFFLELSHMSTHSGLVNRIKRSSLLKYVVVVVVLLLLLLLLLLLRAAAALLALLSGRRRADPSSPAGTCRGLATRGTRGSPRRSTRSCRPQCCRPSSRATTR